MDVLEDQFKQVCVDGCCYILIVIDGVFLMDGYIVKFFEIVVLVEKYDVLIMVDDCYVYGFMGVKGCGMLEYCGVFGKIDIVIGMLGKVLGGVMGGFMVGCKEVIDMLCQCLWFYFFFNLLVLFIVGVLFKVLDMVNEGDDLCVCLFDNVKCFCVGMSVVGFDLLLGEYLIILVMLGDVVLFQQMVSKLMEEGVYVIGFFYLVVFKGQVCICIQMLAVYILDMIDCVVVVFIKVGKDLGVIQKDLWL